MSCFFLSFFLAFFKSFLGSSLIVVCVKFDVVNLLFLVVIGFLNDVSNKVVTLWPKP